MTTTTTAASYASRENCHVVFAKTIDLRSERQKGEGKSERRQVPEIVLDDRLADDDATGPPSGTQD